MGEDRQRSRRRRGLDKTLPFQKFLSQLHSGVAVETAHTISTDETTPSSNDTLTNLPSLLEQDLELEHRARTSSPQPARQLSGKLKKSRRAKPYHVQFPPDLPARWTNGKSVDRIAAAVLSESGGSIGEVPVITRKGWSRPRSDNGGSLELMSVNELRNGIDVINMSSSDRNLGTTVMPQGSSDGTTDVQTVPQGSSDKRVKRESEPQGFQSVDQSFSISSLQGQQDFCDNDDTSKLLDEVAEVEANLGPNTAHSSAMKHRDAQALVQSPHEDSTFSMEFGLQDGMKFMTFPVHSSHDHVPVQPSAQNDMICSQNTRDGKSLEPPLEQEQVQDGNCELSDTSKPFKEDSELYVAGNLDDLTEDSSIPEVIAEESSSTDGTYSSNFN